MSGSLPAGHVALREILRFGPVSSSSSASSLVGQFLEGNLISPFLVGHSVGLHPVWLMFALFAFGYLFGFVGLLLAVPLAAAAGVLIRFAIGRYLENPFYTGVALNRQRRPKCCR